jgi:hypothetical protein
MIHLASWLALILLTHIGEGINLNLGYSDLNLLSFLFIVLTLLLDFKYPLQKGNHFFLPYPSKFTEHDHSAISFTAASELGKQWQ